MVFLLHVVVLPAQGFSLAKQVRSFGDLGVDLFFCLSGFLITGILYSAKEDPHYFRNFYIRRILRIFPLYYLYLILYFIFVIQLHVVPVGGDKISQAAGDLRWAWFYGINLDILAKGHFVTASLNHFWTLAVEEHFYFIWPLLVFFLSRKRLLYASAFLAVACPILRLWMQHRGFSAEAISAFTFCRVDSFAWGGAIRLLLTIPSVRERFGSVGKIAIVTFGALLVVAYSLESLLWFRATSVAAVCSIFIGATALFNETRFGLLRTAPMRFLGKYSYALYVFHHPINLAISHKIVGSILSRTHSLILADIGNMIVVGGLSILVALITWNAVEKRALALKKYFAAGSRPVPLAARAHSVA